MLAAAATRLRAAKLGEHAVSGLGMQKSDELVGGAFKGFRVDEFDTSIGGLFELALDIVGAKGDMVNAAIGIFLEELGDGAFRVGGFQKLQMHFTHAEERSAHLLGRHFLAVFTL